MGRREAIERRVAAAVLAVAGGALAWFVWPQMHLSEALLREGVHAEARVVALDPYTCSYSGSRKNRQYPCFQATGAWTHEGVSYRTTLGFYTHANEAPVGSSVRVLFMPDPAAAAGAAELQSRVVGAGRTLPVSERPIFVGLLALAGLLCTPLLMVLLETWRSSSTSAGQGRDVPVKQD